MNRRQKIIVSVTGIFLVLLLLVGLTYAYFLTQITGNTNNKSISVTTANLALVYGDDDGSIIGENETIIPGTTFEPKTFTVTNQGNATIDSYGVVLENLKITYAQTIGDNVAGAATTLAYPDDFKLTITCTSDVEAKTCNGLDGTLPTTNDILLTNSIDVGETQSYTLTLEYLETGTDQSDDMNKTIEGKVNIIDTNNTVDLAGKVTNYAEGDYVQTNSVQRISQIDSTGNYKVVGLEPGSHTVRVYSSDGTEKGSQIFEIIKGTEAGVSENKITITDDSRTFTIDIDATAKTYTIRENVKIANPYKKGTMAYTLIDNAQNATGEQTILSQPLSKIGSANLETERVLAKTKDDEGTSYYYRGNVIDNYVSFAGMCWRIVRTEGDGAVKLILEDVSETCSSSMDGNWKAGVTEYGVKDYDNNNFFPDYHNSIKQDLKTWFESNANLQSNQSKIKDDTWCISNFKYDRQGNLITEQTTSAYFTVSNPNGTLECFASGEVEGETDIYKLGGLTYDEAKFAGIWGGGIAANYLINTWYYNNSDFWNAFYIINPHSFDNNSSGAGQSRFYIIIDLYDDSNFDFFDYIYPDEYYGNLLRPVITLTKNEIAATKDVSTYGQPGTINNPYVIQ